MNIANKSPLWFPLVAVLAAAGGAHLLWTLLPGVFAAWEARAVDQLYRLRIHVPRWRPPISGLVAYVDLGDSSVRRLKKTYFSRRDYARVIENLAATGVAVQAWDFYFAAPGDSAEDGVMRNAIKRAGNVVLGMAFESMGGNRNRAAEVSDDEIEGMPAYGWRIRVRGSDEDLLRAEIPRPSVSHFTSVSRGLGFLNVTAEFDGVHRRLPLILKCGGYYYPALTLKTAVEFLAVRPEAIELYPGRFLVLPGARFPDGRTEDVKIPVDRSGRMRINFVGGWGAMNHYSFADVFLASEDRDELELWGEELGGKIMIVADVRTGTGDLGQTPVEENYPLAGLHANALETILTGNFLHVPSVGVMLATEFVLYAALIFLAVRHGSGVFVMGVIFLVVAYGLVVAVAFLEQGWVLNWFRPTLALGAGSGMILMHRYVHEEKQKEVLRRSFEAYFPATMVRRLLQNPALVTATGQKKEITLLFSDIRNFTTHTAEMSPEEIRGLLNVYFEAMMEIVFAHGGTVDKFIGDGLMVFFGDPEPQEDHALRCVTAAIAMQKRVRELRREWMEEGKMPLQIRIGINTGTVVVGNMGSSRRLSYTALGAPVNLAQRLESNAPPGGILISRRTHELIGEQISNRACGPIPIKGLEHSIWVYEVILPQDGSDASAGAVPTRMEPGTNE